MNINELLEIAEEFFDNMHPNFCENYIEINYEDVSEFWRITGEFFDQIHPPPDFY